jgi:hypothetical protein
MSDDAPRFIKTRTILCLSLFPVSPTSEIPLARLVWARARGEAMMLDSSTSFRARRAFGVGLGRIAGEVGRGGKSEHSPQGVLRYQARFDLDVGQRRDSGLQVLNFYRSGGWSVAHIASKYADVHPPIVQKEPRMRTNEGFAVPCSRTREHLLSVKKRRDATYSKYGAS